MSKPLSIFKIKPVDDNDIVVPEKDDVIYIGFTPEDLKSISSQLFLGILDDTVKKWREQRKHVEKTTYKNGMRSKITWILPWE